MGWVSEEQIAAAREVDLLTYLQEREPWELKRTGPGEYRTVTHGSLVISNDKWFWNRGGFGGVSCLDYLIKVRGMEFVAAVEMVCGIRAPTLPVSLPVKKHEPQQRDRNGLQLRQSWLPHGNSNATQSWGTYQPQACGTHLA
ncbi:hypothetical protein LJC42_08830 [Eubacteriales bacterium OttesenSCG-928-K08]|nr:hypothetical protein [Eubacteriales bacterium OttesenSCG-928-K08]